MPLHQWQASVFRIRSNLPHASDCCNTVELIAPNPSRSRHGGNATRTTWLNCYSCYSWLRRSLCSV